MTPRERAVAACRAKLAAADLAPALRAMRSQTDPPRSARQVHADLLHGLSEAGFTDEEIAGLGVSLASVRRYVETG